MLPKLSEESGVEVSTTLKVLRAQGFGAQPDTLSYQRTKGSALKNRLLPWTVVLSFWRQAIPPPAKAGGILA